MKVVLVCGGAGFVGQHVVRRLLDEGYEVKVFDRVIPRIGSGIYADLHDFDTLVKHMQGVELVFHLASNADIAASAKNPSIDFEDGTVLTKNVLEAMRITKTYRLLYFSGSGVYGEEPGRLRERDGEFMPVSTYGASKLASEALICAYCNMFGITSRVFRPANIVGSGQTHGVGFDFIRRLKENPYELRVLGNGSQFKSYIHVDDVLDAVWIVMKDYWVRGYNVFNVASDTRMSVADIANAAVILAGNEQTRIIYGEEDRGWVGDVPAIELNCDRLKRTGWRPKFTSQEAITHAMKSML